MKTYVDCENPSYPEYSFCGDGPYGTKLCQLPVASCGAPSCIPTATNCCDYENTMEVGDVVRRGPEWAPSDQTDSCNQCDCADISSCPADITCLGTIIDLDTFGEFCAPGAFRTPVVSWDCDTNSSQITCVVGDGFCQIQLA